MSVTQHTNRSDLDGRNRNYTRRNFRETKPSFMTTEFWAMVAGLVAIIVIYLAAADTSFNLWRAMALGVAVGVGYFVSRGLAKSGSHAIEGQDYGDSSRNDY